MKEILAVATQIKFDKVKAKRIADEIWIIVSEMLHQYIPKYKV